MFHECPTSTGAIFGPPSRAPVLGKAILPLRGHPLFQRVQLKPDSPTASHPIGMALTPQDWGMFFKVYSLRSAVFCANRVTSHRLWLFSMHRPSWAREAIFRIYHPSERATMAPLGNTATPVQPGRLPLAPGLSVSCTIKSTWCNFLAAKMTLQRYQCDVTGGRELHSSGSGHGRVERSYKTLP